MKKLIAMAIVLLTIVVYLQYNAFHLERTITEDGWLVENVNLSEALQAETLKDSIKLQPVSQGDEILRRAGRRYLNQRPVSLSARYPQFVGNGSVLLFWDRSTQLIARDFLS